MYKGKAIYNPTGKAGEYSKWACNFYTGCSNQCDYCYCRRGVFSHIWTPMAKLKKCFKDYSDAIKTFEKEAKANIVELRKHGLFFTFTSDPFLKETLGLTLNALGICGELEIPAIILTKVALTPFSEFEEYKNIITFGHTLTGHDELEPNASPNEQRISNLRSWHKRGYKTWASIEPIVDFDSSLHMIKEASPYCDLFKVGLMSGKKYDQVEGQTFVESLIEMDNNFYIKESLQKLTGYDNSSSDNFVDNNYSLFDNE